MNSFPGGNPFGGMQPSYPGAFPPPPPQGFGQFGSSGGFFGGNSAFPGANPFAGGARFPPAGFPSSPMGGFQQGGGFGFPPASGGFSGFPPGSGGFSGFPPAPGGFSGFPPAPGGFSGFPPGSGGFGGFQPPYAPFPQGSAPPYGSDDYFGSGNYGRPRSRHSSRHRSGSRRRHRRSSSSSSGDDERGREPRPYGVRGPPQYNNFPPFQNVAPLAPGGGSPVIPPRRPAW